MELAEAGYFSKAHGVKGQLVLRHSDVRLSGEVNVLFVELAGSKAPYFVESMKQAAGHLVVSLEGIDSVEKARSLTGKAVYVETKFIETDEAGNDEAWLGYEIIDRHFGVLGKVEGVSDNGQQLLASITYRGQEVILPMVDEFMERVDEAEKKIFYNAPEGLIDLYLGQNQ